MNKMFKTFGLAGLLAFTGVNAEAKAPASQDNGKNPQNTYVRDGEFASELQPKDTIFYDELYKELRLYKKKSKIEADSLAFDIIMNYYAKKNSDKVQGDSLATVYLSNLHTYMEDARIKKARAQFYRPTTGVDSEKTKKLKAQGPALEERCVAAEKAMRELKKKLDALAKTEKEREAQCKKAGKRYVPSDEYIAIQGAHADKEAELYTLRRQQAETIDVPLRKLVIADSLNWANESIKLTNGKIKLRNQLKEDIKIDQARFNEISTKQYSSQSTDGTKKHDEPLTKDHTETATYNQKTVAEMQALANKLDNEEAQYKALVAAKLEEKLRELENIKARLEKEQDDFNSGEKNEIDEFLNAKFEGSALDYARNGQRKPKAKQGDSAGKQKTANVPQKTTKEKLPKASETAGMSKEAAKQLALTKRKLEYQYPNAKRDTLMDGSVRTAYSDTIVLVEYYAPLLDINSDGTAKLSQAKLYQGENTTIYGVEGVKTVKTLGISDPEVRGYAPELYNYLSKKSRD